MLAQTERLTEALIDPFLLHLEVGDIQEVVLRLVLLLHLLGEDPLNAEGLERRHILLLKKKFF